MTAKLLLQSEMLEAKIQGYINDQGRLQQALINSLSKRRKGGAYLSAKTAKQGRLVQMAETRLKELISKEKLDHIIAEFCDKAAWCSKRTGRLATAIQAVIVCILNKLTVVVAGLVGIITFLALNLWMDRKCSCNK